MENFRNLYISKSNNRHTFSNSFYHWSLLPKTFSLLTLIIRSPRRISRFLHEWYHQRGSKRNKASLRKKSNIQSMESHGACTLSQQLPSGHVAHYADDHNHPLDQPVSRWTDEFVQESGEVVEGGVQFVHSIHLQCSPISLMSVCLTARWIEKWRKRTCWYNCPPFARCYSPPRPSGTRPPQFTQTTATAKTSGGRLC